MYKLIIKSAGWDTGDGWSWEDTLDTDRIETMPDEHTISEIFSDLADDLPDNRDELEQVAAAEDADTLYTVEVYEIRTDEDGDEYTDDEPVETWKRWESDMAECRLHNLDDDD